MKIYDCFNFFNELDILELRLNILYDHVDYFVIVEADETHSGEAKPFYLEENMERFKKFSDKIISHHILDTPSNFNKLSSPGSDIELHRIHNFINNQTNRFNRANQPDYGRDFFQKESVRRALIDCNDDDLILISDADEIPNPAIFKTINGLDLDNSLYSLRQPMYCYYLNMLMDSSWCGSKMGKYKNIKDLSFNEIRGDSSLTNILEQGGWHFSFMGGEEMVRKKITSYSARDMVNPNVLDSISKNIQEDRDVFFRCGLNRVSIGKDHPQYLVENINKYSRMIK
jgi:beta-1,4-mannosyl-glycoprotein beta-1,4-N-acetylglucosaminyltransferase